MVSGFLCVTGVVEIIISQVMASTQYNVMQQVTEHMWKQGILADESKIAWNLYRLEVRTRKQEQSNI